MNSHIKKAIRGPEKSKAHFTCIVESAGCQQTDAVFTESESRFKDSAEIASDWIWEMDADLRFSFLSDRYFEVLSIGREEVLGKTREEFANVSAKDGPWRQHLDDLANHLPFQNFQLSTPE